MVKNICIKRKNTKYFKKHNHWLLQLSKIHDLKPININSTYCLFFSYICIQIIYTFFVRSLILLTSLYIYICEYPSPYFSPSLLPILDNSDHFSVQVMLYSYWPFLLISFSPLNSIDYNRFLLLFFYSIKKTVADKKNTSNPLW